MLPYQLGSYQGPHNPYINLLIIDSLSYPFFTMLLVIYHDIINIFNHASIVFGPTAITINCNIIYNNNYHQCLIAFVKSHYFYRYAILYACKNIFTCTMPYLLTFLLLHMHMTYLVSCISSISMPKFLYMEFIKYKYISKRRVEDFFLYKSLSQQEIPFFT